MKQTNKLFQKDFSLKFTPVCHRAENYRFTDWLYTAINLYQTGCGSNRQQQSTLPVTEPIPIENPAQEESTQETQNQSVPEQPDMEQPSQAEDNQSQFSLSTQSVPEKVKTETVAPSPDVSSSSLSYLGTWQITSSTFGAYSAMSEEDCSALVGTRFEYFKDYAIYDDQHRLDSPPIFRKHSDRR